MAEPGLQKLGLGTVQFGLPYGVSNRRGQVPRADAAAILALAAKGGIRTLDTAANYGSAEQVLAGLDTGAFRIVTKTIGVKAGVDAVVARARESARLLKADTLLVHAAGDLEDPALWPALQALKAEGVEVHARSIFLQGLLFLRDLPPKLQHIAPRLSAIRKAIGDAGGTPLAAALGFALSRREIGTALVGVTTADELKEILTAAAHPLPALDWPSYALQDDIVLTPSRW